MKQMIMKEVMLIVGPARKSATAKNTGGSERKCCEWIPVVV
jgi:hypothetical protein